MIRSLPMLPRWGRRSTLLDSSALRVQCGPPSLRHAPGSLWQRMMFWLIAPAPQDAAPPLHRLPGVRTDFMASVADISSEEADCVRLRIHEARSLRDLWHVRAEIYRVVAVTHSQTQAEQRLLLLNRHFPTRSPRSQFLSL